jgi:hypothetical protein
MVRLARWGLVVLLVTAGPSALEAGVIEVPRDALRLDRALALAQSGDTVRVDPGLYRGPFRLPPGVRLESSRGAGATRLEAPGSPWVIQVRGGGPTTAVVGFSVEGGRVGVDLDRGVLQLLRCRVSGADSLGVRCGFGSHARILSTDVTGIGIGVSVEPGADVLLLSCLLARNALGVQVSAEDTRIFRCRFEENDLGVRVTAMGTARVGDSLRDGNDFMANGLAMENLADTAAPAAYNYWGTTDPDSVAVLLRGPITFRPFTDAAHRDELDPGP